MIIIIIIIIITIIFINQNLGKDKINKHRYWKGKN